MVISAERVVRIIGLYEGLLVLKGLFELLGLYEGLLGLKGCCKEGY
jgi:hypothetical protein